MLRVHCSLIVRVLWAHIGVHQLLCPRGPALVDRGRGLAIICPMPFLQQCEDTCSNARSQNQSQDLIEAGSCKYNILHAMSPGQSHEKACSGQHLQALLADCIDCPKPSRHWLLRA